MKSILPIILIILALTGAITYTLSKRAIPAKPTNSIGVPANQLDNDTTPTPTSESNKVTFGSITVSPTPTVTPTILPSVAETKPTNPSTKVATTTITKTTVCTPVYGSANDCVEHTVVETGAESAAFFNLAGLAYIGGLLSFVKAKTLKK